jgi:hypothetical protein
MRYISPSVISFSLRLKGREDSVRVDFTPLTSGGSTYSTDEQRVIEALEKSPMFGKFYKRAPECVNEDVKPTKKSARKSAAAPKKTEVTEVNGWQDAVEYLVNHHGCDASKLTSPATITAEAEKVGVTFPNL